ncbi:MAG: hypothetical protein ACP5G1_03455 [Nanopusillaceae archaeon]
MSEFSLSEKEFKEIWHYVQFYLTYKNVILGHRDYQLRYAFFKFGSKTASVGKWQDESFWTDFDKAYKFIEDNNVIAISQTLLKNEIVLEPEGNYEPDEQIKKSTLVTKFLNVRLEVPCILVFSGNKSFHIHLFFNQPLTDEEKRAIKEKLEIYTLTKFDLHGFVMNHVWRLPFSYHPETKKRAELLIPPYIKNSQFLDYYVKLGTEGLSQIETIAFAKMLEIDKNNFLAKLGINLNKK